MEIRPLNDGDSRLAVSHVYEESWRFAYRGIVPRDYLDSLPAGRWVGRFEGPGTTNLVALEYGGIVGTSSFGRSRFPDMTDYGEVYSLYLLPEWIGKGIGAALLSAAMDSLMTSGYRGVFLWTLEENARARRFYEKMGFAYRGKTRRDSIGGCTLTEVCYERRLT